MLYMSACNQTGCLAEVSLHSEPTSYQESRILQEKEREGDVNLPTHTLVTQKGSSQITVQGKEEILSFSFSSPTSRPPQVMSVLKRRFFTFFAPGTYLAV